MSESTNSETSISSLDFDKMVETPITKFNAECVRKRSNWSTVRNEFKMDNPDFEPDFFLKDMPAFSPKLVALLDQIEKLDTRDQKKYGKTFKHFIFSDIKMGGQGAKMLASALIANGWKLGYKSDLKNRDKIEANKGKDKKIDPQWGPLTLLDQNNLLESRKKNFFLLSSVGVFEKPIGVRMKKDILTTFNSRPENIYGDLARIIVMDSGFKEGIDLFDIKYIHIFEPSMNAADQKQVIGRGTRTCGQRGLEFHPTRGWPLEVFIYDLEIPEKLRFSLLGAENAQELLMKAMDADIRIANLGYDIERLTVIGSVDYELNKNVHDFQVDLSETEEEIVLGGSTRSATVATGSMNSKRQSEQSEMSVVKFGYDEMKKYIKKNFSQYSWENVKMENMCGEVPDAWKKFTWEPSPEIVLKVADELDEAVYITAKDDEEESRKSSRKSSRKTQKSQKSMMSQLTESSYRSPSSLNESEEQVEEEPESEAEAEETMTTLTRTPRLSSRASQLEPTSSLIESPKSEETRTLLDSQMNKESEPMTSQPTTLLESEQSEQPEPEEEQPEEEQPEEEQPEEEQQQQIGGSSILSFTPSQDFVRNYFTPFAPVKGMLLYHSVGTGKTCSAIAAASTNFEPFDYTILWVTRTTLKSDIWKNMFDQVCSKAIQDRISAGEVIPDLHKERMRLLSKSWRIRPLSYKQFSNLVSKKNQYYDQLVKENGEADPLQKTLLIIDEAHKLYGGGDLSSIERPDMVALHQALMNSYSVSGANSVRLLLMTATPITENPMELVKLMNLCKPIDQQMPDTFDLFAAQYLKEDGTFTTSGQKRYLDDIAGYISYLNREKDARQFSQPRIQRISVPMVSESQMQYVEDFDVFIARSEVEDDVLKMQERLENNLKEMESQLPDVSKLQFQSFYNFCEKYENIPKNKCDTIIKKNINALMKEIKGHTRAITDKIKSLKGELATIKKGQQSKLVLIKRKIKENPRLFSQYKSSTYAAMRENCSKKVLNNTQFIEAVQQLPEMIDLDNEVNASKEKIKMLENQLSTDIQSYKQKIKQMKESLFVEMPPVEKAVIESSIRENETGLNETKKMRTKEIKKEINMEKTIIKKTELAKKQLFVTVRKTMKKREKLKQKEEKQSKKAAISLKKAANNQEVLNSEIKDNDIKDLAEKRKAIIERNLAELQNKIQHKTKNKKEKAQDKAHQKQIKFTLKQRALEEERERKNLEKMRANKTRKL